MKFKVALATAAVMIAALAPAAQAVTIDFSSLANGTPVTNQFAGVTVSLSGGVDNGPAIIADVFSSGLALTNSTSSYYPTAYTLTFSFTGEVSDISFDYNNFGTLNGGSFTAFSGASIVDTGSLDTIDGYHAITLPGSGITSLTLNNGNITDWQIGVRSLSFTPTASAVPEPTTWAMMIGGMSLVGASMRRRKAVLRFA